MEDDLWGPPSYPAEEEDNCVHQPGWQCDFYSGDGIDVIEENAMNEKSCVQVLKIWIASANTEIYELENDLVLLRNKLAWAEYEDWSQLCCDALKERISSLDVSVMTLRNNNTKDSEVPVKSLHEVIKDLLKSYCQQKRQQGEQNHDVAVSEPHSASLHAAVLKEEGAVSKEENTGSSSGSTGYSGVLTSSLEILEETTIDAKMVPLPNVNIEELDSHSLKLTTDEQNKTKVLKSLDQCTAMLEAKEYAFTALDSEASTAVDSEAFTAVDSEDSTAVELEASEKTSFRKLTDKETAEFPESQEQQAPTKTSAENQFRGYCNQKRKLAELEAEFQMTSVEDKSTLSTSDFLLLSSFMRDLGENFKLPDSLKLTTDGSDKTEVLKSLDQCTGIGEAKEHNCTAFHGEACEISSIHLRETPEMTKSQQPAPTMKISDANASNHSTGYYNKKIKVDAEAKVKMEIVEHHSSLSTSDVIISKPKIDIDEDIKPEKGNGKDSGLNKHPSVTSQLKKIQNSYKSPKKISTAAAFGQETSGTSEIQQKLCNFASEVSRKKSLAVSKAVSTRKERTSNPIREVEEKKKYTSQTDLVDEVPPTATQLASAITVLDAKDMKEKYASTPKYSESIRTRAQKNDMLILKRFPETQSRNARVIKAEGVQYPNYFSVHDVLGSSYGSDAPKSKITKKILHHKQSNTPERKSNQLGCEDTNSLALTTYKPNSQLECHDNNSLALAAYKPYSQLDCEDNDSLILTQNQPCEDNNIALITYNHCSPDCTDSSDALALASSIPTADELKKLKVAELRKIAKEYKVKKIYSLKKMELLEEITKHLAVAKLG